MRTLNSASPSNESASPQLSPNRALKRGASWLLLSSLVLSFGLACGGASSNTPAAASASSSGSKEPADDAPLTDPPDPPKAEGNPLVGLKMYVDPESLAQLRVNALKTTDQGKAAIIEKIAKQPQALWLGEWNTNIFRTAQYNVEKAKDQGAVPIFVAYNIPNRDCGQHSSGGTKTKDDYRRWIRKLAAGIGDGAAVVIMEPDALPMIDKENCLSQEQKEERLFLLRDAVKVLRQNPKTIVYIDAGHPRWNPAEYMATQLKKAGIEFANGFSLNTSNYVGTEDNLEYGKKLSGLLGGVHFVIDTSRNGNGPPSDPNEWCNPPGRKIGKPPTLETGEPLADGFMWLKRPGESDGECHGGPRAGVFWDEKALELAQ
ncbi:MAG TPA: glycoside hydrolase family 6 protein [Polyangiaceae bacterium]|nr:glycoside hydrolase family 6 protein [Polyangiaceae bacterium]